MVMLLMGDQFANDSATLRRHAELPEHWYRIPGSAIPPGLDPAHVMHASLGFRIVFSITFWPAVRPQPFRCLTMSHAFGYPPALYVFTVGHALGFTNAEMHGDTVVGPGPDWGFDHDRDDHCAVLQQAAPEFQP